MWEGGKEALPRTSSMVGREGPTGKKVFQPRIVPMPPARSVHVETDGDAVGIEGHEENNAQL